MRRIKRKCVNVKKWSDVGGTTASVKTIRKAQVSEVAASGLKINEDVVKTDFLFDKEKRIIGFEDMAGKGERLPSRRCVQYG